MLTVVGLVFAVFGGLYLGLWLVAPLPAALLFIAVTWFHWGQGDVHGIVAFVDARHLVSRAQRSGTLVVRGGLPMLLLLVAFPDRYRAVVSWMDARKGLWRQPVGRSLPPDGVGTGTSGSD